MNGYLLDTNVPSEFSRDRPEPRVVKWLKAQPVTTLKDIAQKLALL